jgi:hypothetical protein
MQHDWKESFFYCKSEQMLEAAVQAWNSLLICVVRCGIVASYGHGIICQNDLQHYAFLDLDGVELMADFVIYLDDVWKSWNSVHCAGTVVELWMRQKLVV